MRDGEGRLRRLDDLANFNISHGDDARDWGFEFGIAEPLLRDRQLRGRRIDGGFRRTPRRLGLIVIAAGGVAFGQQILLSVESRAVLAQLRVGRIEHRLRGRHIRVLFLRVDFGEDLADAHVTADLGVALENAAADPEGDVGLELRADLAGQRQLGLVIGLRQRDCLDALERPLHRAGRLAGGQNRQRHAADKSARKLCLRQRSHEEPPRFAAPASTLMN